MSTVQERVALGVALLNERRPNWRSQVDIDVLEMNDRSWCIIGQVFGVNPDDWSAVEEYVDALTALGVHGGEGGLYGFDLTREQYEAYWGEHDKWEELTSAWLEVL